MKNNKLYEDYHTNTSVQFKIIKENNFTYKLILQVLNKYLKSEKNVLDIGCGAGTLTMYMAVLGIDISEKAVHAAQKSAEVLDLKNISFKAVEFPNEVPTDTYDFILCSEVIEHLENDTLALKKIYQLLKPEGIAMITTPSINAPMYRLGLANEFDKRVGHLRRYTLDALALKCQKAGFTIIGMKKNEGILRNFLFLNPIAGKFIRFIKFFLVDVVTYLDNATVPLFGESDLIVVLEKSSDLFCEAAKYVSSLKMVSVKMIQEQFKIGNASSEKLLEQLAQAGFVEPDNGLEQRKVNQSAIFLPILKYKGSP